MATEHPTNLAFINEIGHCKRKLSASTMASAFVRMVETLRFILLIGVLIYVVTNLSQLTVQQLCKVELICIV